MVAVKHRWTEIDGVNTFYREAGPSDAPVVLLPHGYPASSYVYTGLMAELGDQWRLVAPDLPGFGQSATPAPESFGYTFEAYSRWLQSFVTDLGLSRYVIWLHDYGSQFGLQLAMWAPGQVAGLVIQNGDIYPHAFGPKYDKLREMWDHPGPDARRGMAAHASLKGFEDEFRSELPEAVQERVPPDLWTLHWALMSTPERLANLVRLLEDQPTTLAWMEEEQAYLREHQPATLIVWGPHDGYMPEKSARAYDADLPDAEVHILGGVHGGGHWLLQTHLDEVAPLVRSFLTRLPAPRGID